MQDLIDACEDVLGKRFNVSTIQKDIEAMKNDQVLNYNAPIKFSRSYSGYYYSDPTFTIKKINLNDSDIENLKTVVDILSNYSQMNVSLSLSKSIEKVLASIKESYPDYKTSTRIIQTDTTDNHLGYEHFDFFIEAIRTQTPVSFVHYSYTNRAFKSNIIHPYLLKEFKGNWYVVGFSEAHRELRTFGLDRVYDPLKLDRRFTPDKEQVAKHYFKNIYGVYPIDGRKVHEVIFNVNPLFSDYINAHPIHSSQKRLHQHADGSSVFRIEVIPSYELVNLFMSYSSSLSVESPKSIKNMILKNIRKANYRYEKDAD